MPEYRPKKKKKSRAGSVVLTLVVFVLFLAIFGGVCLWAFIDNRLPPDSVSSAASGEDASPRKTGPNRGDLSPSGRIRRMGGSTPLPSRGKPKWPTGPPSSGWMNFFGKAAWPRRRRPSGTCSGSLLATIFP